MRLILFSTAPVDKRVRLQGKNGHQHIHAVGQKTFCMKDEFGKEVYVDFCNIMIATQVYLSKSVLKRLEDHVSRVIFRPLRI